MTYGIVTYAATDGARVGVLVGERIADAIGNWNESERIAPNVMRLYQEFDGEIAGPLELQQTFGSMVRLAEDLSALRWAGLNSETGCLLDPEDRTALVMPERRCEAFRRT